MTRRIDLSRFKKRSDVWSMLTVVAHLALVLAPVYIAVLQGPNVYWIALWLWFGLLANGLLNLMHECAHYHAFKDRNSSDFLGRWVLGPLLVSDFDGYRWRHWKHHIHLGTDDDTKDAYLVDIHGLKLLGFFLQCLTLREAVRAFRHQTAEKHATDQQRSKAVVWLGRTACVHLLLFASLLLTAGPAAHQPWARAFIVAVLAYIFIYGYGLASLTVFAATLRAIAEHQVEPGQSSSAGRAVLRNFKCGALSRLIFGAYGFAEHATHHCEPGLPYYHLAETTRELAADDPEFAPNQGYIDQLLTLCKSLPPRLITEPTRKA